MFYKYIFCILTYKNDCDLVECLNSINEKVKNYKIVIVNSFYDDVSMEKIQIIASRYNCDFYNIENKGYSFGNNYGIKNILINYDFEYVAVINPDILIDKFDDSLMDKYKNCVIAPMITTIKGKNQNPYWLIKNNLSEKLMYFGQKRKNLFLYFLGVVINKAIREIGIYFFFKSKKDIIEIYAAHGAFVFFQKEIFENIGLFYDENMFLFAEEAYIAHIFEKYNIKTYLIKNIKIIHKEDGSLNNSNIKINEELRKSTVYYYEKIKKI